jgi:hypothetical protein
MKGERMLNKRKNGLVQWNVSGTVSNCEKLRNDSSYSFTGAVSESERLRDDSIYSITVECFREYIKM